MTIIIKQLNKNQCMDGAHNFLTYILYTHTHTTGNHMILGGKFVRIYSSRKYTQNMIIKLHNY